MKKFLKVLIATLVMLVSSGINSDLFAAQLLPDAKEVTILATSDLHNFFVDYDYAQNSETGRNGITRVSSYVKEVRNSGVDPIVIDNGDTFQGNSSSLYIGSGEILPIVKAMKMIGYDVWNTGNHEYNFGMNELIQQKNFFEDNGVGRMLVANVYKDGNRVADAYTVTERDGIKVATIGVVTPHITKWDSVNMQGYDVTNPYDEVNALINEIQNATPDDKSDDLAEVIVVSFHASVDGEYGNDSAEELAELNPEIDVIVAGHAHEKHAYKSAAGPVIVEPGRFGENVSKVVLKVDSESNVEVASCENVVTSEYAEDEEVKAALDSYHQLAVDDALTVIGTLEGGDLVKKDEITGIPTSQIEDTAMIDLILNVQMDVASEHIPAGAKHVSAAASFSSTANILEGEIKKSDSSKIYRYDNFLYVLKVNKAQLVKYMEWSLGFYNTFKDGDITLSFNENIRGYNYDMFAGVNYDVDVTKPVGERLTGLKYSDGSEVGDSDEIYLTINNYRANTTLLNDENGLFANEGVEVVYDSTNENTSAIRDMITEYIMAEKVITPVVDNNWKIIGNEVDEDLYDITKKLVNRGDLEVPKSADGRTDNVRSLTMTDIEGVTESVDLLSINDFHGAVEEDKSEYGKNPGASKLGQYFIDSETNNPNTLILSAGDNYQGTALSNLSEGMVVNDFFDYVGLDYSAVGNHEFDFGREPLVEWSKSTKFLGANIVNKKSRNTSPDWVEPYSMDTYTVAGREVNVAIIGIATPDTYYSTDPTKITDLDFLNPVTTVTKYEKIARDAGADYVFVLAHSPTFMDNGAVVGEGADIAANTTVDGVFSGHSHQTVDGEVRGVPVLQGYYNGRAVSKMSVVYSTDGEYLGTYGMVDSIFTDKNSLATNNEIDAIVEGYNENLGEILGEVVATTETGLSHSPANGDWSGEGQVTPMGYEMARLAAESNNTDIAILNGGGVRRGFEVGDITYGDIYEAFPFDNTLVTVEVTGEHLKRLLEHGINPDGFKSGQYYGVNVYYDSNANEITAMRLNDGTLVEMDKTYKITSIDFLVNGGDKYDFSGAVSVVDTFVFLRTAIKEQVELEKVVNASIPKVQNYKPLNYSNDPGPVEITGTSNIIEFAYGSDVTALSIVEKLGINVDGATLTDNNTLVTADGTTYFIDLALLDSKAAGIYKLKLTATNSMGYNNTMNVNVEILEGKEEVVNPDVTTPTVTTPESLVQTGGVSYALYSLMAFIIILVGKKKLSSDR